MLEEVTTRDETSAICVHGARTLPSGALTSDGPPTTHSDTGIDRIAFVQANLTHDNTQFVNGTPVGDRHIFQVCISYSRLEVYLSLHYRNLSTERIMQGYSFQSTSVLAHPSLLAGGSRPWHWQQVPFL